MTDNERSVIRGSLSKIHVIFWTSDLVDLSQATFGKSQSIAYALLSGAQCPSSITDAMKDVFSHRSYWKRLWIVQESLLAKEAIFVCGHRNMNLKMMSLVAIALNLFPLNFR
jgi:hypothetical protein